MRSLLVIENERLIGFLDNNQLVQANAVVSKLEGMIRKQLEDPYDSGVCVRTCVSAHEAHEPPHNEPKETEPPVSPHEPQTHEPPVSPREPDEHQYRPENHPYWPCFRAVHRVRQFILAGMKDKALMEAKAIASRL